MSISSPCLPVFNTHGSSVSGEANFSGSFREKIPGVTVDLTKDSLSRESISFSVKFPPPSV